MHTYHRQHLYENIEKKIHYEKPNGIKSNDLYTSKFENILVIDDLNISIENNNMNNF